MDRSTAGQAGDGDGQLRSVPVKQAGRHHYRLSSHMDGARALSIPTQLIAHVVMPVYKTYLLD